MQLIAALCLELSQSKGTTMSTVNGQRMLELSYLGDDIDKLLELWIDLSSLAERYESLVVSPQCLESKTVAQISCKLVSRSVLGHRKRCKYLLNVPITSYGLYRIHRAPSSAAFLNNVASKYAKLFRTDQIST